MSYANLQSYLRFHLLLLASTYANLQSYLRVLAFTYGYLLLLRLTYDLKALTFTYAYLQLKGTHFHFAYYAATYDGIEHYTNHYLSLYTNCLVARLKGKYKLE